MRAKIWGSCILKDLSSSPPLRRRARKAAGSLLRRVVVISRVASCQILPRLTRVGRQAFPARSKCICSNRRIRTATKFHQGLEINMGWLWSSGEALEDKKQSSPEARVSDTKQPPPQAVEFRKPPDGPPKTRDEIAEAELQAFLDEINDASRAPTSQNLPQRQQPGHETSPSDAGSGKISPYPTSMSCTTAFDAAWFCQLPGGQFVNVYRYGSLRNCSDAWTRFWFCMRTNRGYMSDEQRQDRVRRYYQERENRLLRGRNSEEVWEARTEKFAGAFGDRLPDSDE